MNDRRQFFRHASAAALSVAASAACRRASSLQGFQWLVGPASANRTSHSTPRADAVPQAVLRCLARLAYGPRPGDVDRVLGMGADAWIEEQLSPGAITDLPARWLVRRVATVDLGLPDVFDLDRKTVLTDLRRATILRAVASQRQLLERMVEFWSDHFNVYVGKADCAWLKVIDDREVIRRHALANFRDLLRASAVSPAMLEYLDGRANAAGRPNENYAREILELHTLGVDGGYSQRDVMELARALTGWRLRKTFWRGRAFFEPALHDGGTKEVLGARLSGGAQVDLDRVLDRLCGHPSTARHLAAKLCRRFVGESVSPGLVERVAAAFTQSRGDIRATLSAILHSEEFLHAPLKLRRPYDFAIATLRSLGASTDGGPALQECLASMGQLPFDWPTPDGYPDEASAWEARLLPRWNFALMLACDGIRGTRVEPEILEDATGLAERLLGRRLDRGERQALALAGPGREAAALALCHPQLQLS